MKKVNVCPDEIIVNLEDAKKIELNLLLMFRNICDKHKLNYSLAYGTLLGAVRHKGFIPWDDDIDVMMPREDFKKFLKFSEREMSDSFCRVISMYNFPNYFAPLPKISDDRTIVYQYYGQVEKIKTGIYIDIFIVDGLPDVNANEHYKKANRKRWRWNMACRKIFARHQSRNLFFDIMGSLVSLPYKFLGINYYRNKYDKHCSSFPFYNSNNVAVVMYGEGIEKEKMKKTDFLESSYVTFEGERFKAVKNPDEYLTKMYGEYMRLPPEEERIGKHPNKMVWKTKNL